MVPSKFFNLRDGEKLLSLQHAMVRVVSEAVGQTLAEGEGGRRSSGDWVLVCFVLNLLSKCYIDNLFHFSFYLFSEKIQYKLCT